MEVAPFFVDFHHFLSIFTIFYQFSRFTHFFRKFILAQITFSATSHVFCMYAVPPVTPCYPLLPPVTHCYTHVTPYNNSLATTYPPFPPCYTLVTLMLNPVTSALHPCLDIKSRYLCPCPSLLLLHKIMD